MQDDKQQGENKKLSYELLLQKLEEQNKIIASLTEDIEDVKAVVKANFTTGSKEQGDEHVDEKTNKDKFEKKLEEVLGLC